MESIKGSFIFEDEVDVVLSTLGASIDVALDEFEKKLKNDPYTNYDKTIDDNLGDRGVKPPKKEYTIKEAEEIIMTGNDYEPDQIDYDSTDDNCYGFACADDSMSDDIVSDEDMMNNLCIGEYIDKIMNI